MEEIRNRVGRITNDLNSLLNEITAGRQDSCELEHVLTSEVIKGFKTSVDADAAAPLAVCRNGRAAVLRVSGRAKLARGQRRPQEPWCRRSLGLGDWVVYRKGRSNCRKENTCHGWRGRAGLLTHRRTASGLGFRDDD